MTDVCARPQKEEQTAVDADMVDGPAFEKGMKTLLRDKRKAMRIRAAGLKKEKRLPALQIRQIRYSLQGWTLLLVNVRVNVDVGE